MKITTDSFKYYINVRQSDPDLPYLLMFHGFMGRGMSFKPLVNSLKPFCNPVTVDLAGHGRTTSPEDPEYYSAERQIAHWESILNQLELENLFIYGYSMGGRLAFQLLASYPERFSGALIESAHCGIFSEAEREKRKEKDEERAAEMINHFDEFIEDWQKMPLFYAPGSDSSDGHYEEIMRKQKPELLRASLLGFGAGSMPPVCNKLTDIELPVTLLAGEYDKKYCRILSDISKLNPGFTFVKAEGAAHRVHRDRPDTLIMELRLLLDR